MLRAPRVAVVILAALLATPSALFAQAVLTGVVHDASGAVLPGVTVEAASPDLIEKVRTAVSDGTGQYRIIDLRPGTFSLTFTLAGFGTVKRDGIVLTGTTTVVVNADLKVGSVEETVNVTGAAPLVDVQGIASERSITRDLIDAIPTGRTIHTMANLIPGVNLQTTTAGVTNATADVGGSAVAGFQQASIHGGMMADQRVLLDGFSVHSAAGNVSAYVPNQASTQEFTVDTASLSAEDSSGGVRMSIIPREGGNVFHVTMYGDGTGPGLQSSNYTSDLAARGFPAPNPAKALKQSYTINPAAGGPLIKDTLWFYSAASRLHNQQYLSVYPNANAGNPNAWLYVPDTNATFPFLDTLMYSGNTRLTWQMNAKNKLAFYSDVQVRCQCPQVAANIAPEALTNSTYPGGHLVSLTYTAPLTNRLLIDAAAVTRLEHTNSLLPPGTDRSFIGVLDSVTGIRYRSKGEETRGVNQNDNERAAVSWVTGAHSVKFGFQNQWASSQNAGWSNPSYTDYTFANGVPTTITLYADPRDATTLSMDFGAFVQDRWTIKRFTLSTGLRFDRYHSYYPENTLGPVALAPTRNVDLPATDGATWKDITYRLGGAFDVFGDGRTAVKMSLNKYLGATGNSSPTALVGGALNPALRVAVSTTRSWNDANKNFVPDCNMQNPLANGECGAYANAAFGQPFATTTYDPAILNGWGIRDYNWEFAASVQHQILKNLSMDVGYYRRSYGNFKVTDNLSVAASDFTAFSIVAPVDSRLPGGGGQTISGLYNVVPAKFGQTNNFITNASNYGDVTQRWQGVDASASLRASGGLTFQGGISTGNTLIDYCAVRANLPELSITPSGSNFYTIGPAMPYCRIDTNFLTQFKGMGTYRLPKADVQVSVGIQSSPGPMISANFNATNAFTQPSLGRVLSGNAANVSVNLVPTGTLYGDRVNEVDMRVSKLFRFAGRGKLSANLDLFNMFNVSPVTLQNDGFVPTSTTWQQPTQVLTARTVKLSAQFDF